VLLIFANVVIVSVQEDIRCSYTKAASIDSAVVCENHLRKETRESTSAFWNELDNAKSQISFKGKLQKTGHERVISTTIEVSLTLQAEPERTQKDQNQ